MMLPDLALLTDNTSAGPRTMRVHCMTPCRPPYVRTLLCALALMLALPQAHAADFRLLSSWTPDYIGVPKIVERYIRKIEEAAAGELRFVIVGPEAIPVFDQFELAAIGIFDLLFTHGAFHVGNSAMGIALDAIEADPATLRAAGVWAAVDAHYQARGLKLLAMPASRSGYHLLLREPVSASCDLAGRRVRGAPNHAGLLTALGARRIELPAAEVEQALDDAALDGFVWPSLHAPKPAWLDTSRYFTRPTFGTFTHLILMNLAAWNTLSPESRALLLGEGVVLEVRIWKRSLDYVADVEALHNQRGVQATALCGDTVAQTPKLWADGVWEAAIAQSDEEVRHLRALARAAGITP
jgi:TRAP-type transport system periplasmic protein